MSDQDKRVHETAALDRRSFLKGVAALSAATAGAGLPVANEVRAQVAEQDRDPRASQWIRAQCPLCSVGCSLAVGIEKGRAVAAKGDTNSPVNAGLACAKGYHAIQALYGSDRLTRAQIRRNGQLVHVPLAEAFDFIANRVRTAREQSGNDSVGIIGPSGWNLTDSYIASKLFGASLGSANVDTADRLESASATTAIENAFGLPGVAGNFEDVDHADVVVLWNCNLAETDPVLFSRILERRRLNPAVRILEIKTRTTRTSYAADQSMVCAPGTEAAIAHAMCHSIVAARNAHREFINRYVAFKRDEDTRPISADQPLAPSAGSDSTWDEYVRFLESYTSPTVQGISGVQADWIDWVATLYADRGRKVTTIWGDSVARQATGLATANALHNLHLLVGKIGSSGNALLPMMRGTALPPQVRPGRATQRDVEQIVRAFEDGSVKVLWLHAWNAAVMLPGTNRLRRTANSDQCLVVSDSYPTETTARADVVLPTSLWIEQSNVSVNAERRLQYHGAAVAPPGDSSSSAWQMIQVARRLQMSPQFGYSETEYAVQIHDELLRTNSSSTVALPSVGALQRRSGLLWPVTGDRETTRRYATAHDTAASKAQGDYDFYGHADRRAWIWFRPTVDHSERVDRAYPLVLEAGNVLEQADAGTLTRRIAPLHRAAPRAFVEMHPDDARRLNVVNGQRVRLTSRRGSVDIEARINHRSQPERGRLFAPWFDEQAPVLTLMEAVRCARSGQRLSSRCAVRLEPLSGTAT